MHIGPYSAEGPTMENLYVAGPFPPFEACPFQDAPDDWIEAYAAANIEAMAAIFALWPPTMASILKKAQWRCPRASIPDFSPRQMIAPPHLALFHQQSTPRATTSPFLPDACSGPRVFNM